MNKKAHIYTAVYIATLLVFAGPACFSAEPDSRYYPVTVERVVDGDTVDLLIDLGFDTISQQRVRLWGIDTPEMSTDQGKLVRHIVVKLIESRKVSILPIRYKQRNPKMWRHKRGARGRYLVLLFYEDDDGYLVNINDHLLKNGFAKELKY